MKIFTGQKNLLLENILVVTGEAALQNYETNTDTTQLNITLSTNGKKQNKRQLLSLLLLFNLLF